MPDFKAACFIPLLQTPTYFPGVARGRGRGGGGVSGEGRSPHAYQPGTSPVRGRGGGFVRRPYGHQRGGFKPTNGYNQHNQVRLITVF